MQSWALDTHGPVRTPFSAPLWLQKTSLCPDMTLAKKTKRTKLFKV